MGNSGRTSCHLASACQALTSPSHALTSARMSRAVGRSDFALPVKFQKDSIAFEEYEEKGASV